ncbi:hypothetical protein D9M68_331020 [compost metagenome]
MTALTSAQLLALWEHGARRHPLDRALLLFAVAAPDSPPETLADAPLGACNAALMRLRWETFGTRLPLWLDCPCCGERLEFELEPAQLPPMVAPPSAVEVAGLRFRCPASRDLAAVANLADTERAARRLLLACAERAEALPVDEQVLGELAEAVEAALESADPWADLALAFRCPACGADGEASLDVAGYLWEEVDGSARQLLDEIHLLAQAYGWSEAQILALGDVRRGAYLARVAP